MPPPSGIIHTIAGVSGQSGYSAGGGAATSVFLESPSGLALDGAGNLYIGDWQFIRVLNLASGVIQTLVGASQQGSKCVLTASNPCPGSQVLFALYGQTIAFANGHLYAAVTSFDLGFTQSNAGAILDIDPGTGMVRLIAGGNTFAGSSPSYPAIPLYLSPVGLAADAAGNLYITGTNQPPSNATPNSNPAFPSIEELRISDYTTHLVAGTATSTVSSGDGGPATMAGVAPASICISPAGNVVFVDVFNIRSFPVGGNIAPIAGNGAANFFGDGGTAQQAGLDLPSDVVSDAQGNVYLADEFNRRVRRIDAATGIITTVAGGGTLSGAAINGKPAVQAALFPADIALDNSNHLYLRDLLTGLSVVDLTSGIISPLLPNADQYGPMLFDGAHTLYIAIPHAAATQPQAAFNDQVWAIDLTTDATTVIAGAGALAAQPSGDGGPATQATLYDVEGLALDGQGHLDLADYSFYNVRQIDLATGIITTIAGTPVDTASGSPYGYSGDGGQATAAKLKFPAGLAYDGVGHLTIADRGNNVLRQIDLTSGIIDTIAGDHTPGYGGDGGAPTSAMLYTPNAIAYDPAGNLLIADTQNDRLRRVVLHPTPLKAALTYAAASGDGIAWTATYSGLSFGIAPTGSVVLSSGGTSLGSGTLSPDPNGSGDFIATIASSSLPANQASVTAQYSGDANYASAATTVTFQPLAPSYTVSVQSPSLTIQRGVSGSLTFSVTPQNGFDQPVSFSCSSATLPQGVSCSFSPASVTPNESAATTTLTVQTTGVTQSALAITPGPLSRWLPRGGALLALLLVGIPNMRRKLWLNASALIFFAVCLAGMVGCCGSSSGGAAQNAKATPPGNYSFEVTTSAGTAAAAAPVKVSLTVTQ